MQFKNLKQLVIYFGNDEQKCRDFLAKERWGNKPICVHCQHDKCYRFTDGRLYKCAKCRKQFTVTMGTIFENSKVPLSTWFAAIYLCTAHKKGISSIQLAKDLGVTQKTSWFMLMRIKEMTKVKDRAKMTRIVEVDETYVGGKERNKSNAERKAFAEGKRKAEKTPVIGIVERKGMAYLQVAKDVTGGTLKGLVREAADRMSIIVTDSFSGYTGLRDQYIGHVTVNHSQNEYISGIYHTNTVEGFFSILKRSILGIFHHLSVKHLQRYCDEISFRYNTRYMEDAERFYYTLTKTEGRLTYKRLITAIN
ncbi:IS1595 family transposase [Filimonas effusa]|uniref:IS1595 family transposase n=1 Tax=Filimonas effusa TaxID=2508721 RepID=A0A4Q1DBF7_9BACT|nr:IS1595 family transposase [Filimonas effusa]RXK86248.1 IS1595 family transposase [Filimonas effusa]